SVQGIVEKDMVCWTGMVACYAENDCFEEALDLFNLMRMEALLPNNFTFASVIKACLGLEAVGRDIEDARQVFEEIPKDNVVPWSFMIARYSQSDYCEEALDLFFQMRKALIHCHVLKVGLDLNIFVLNALMDVYAKCGKMEASINLFVESKNKNDVSWNTMIVGLLRASASLAALEAGIQIHTMTIKTLYDGDDAVSNALIDMYAKCGRIRDARLVFDTMNERDVVSWNSMISAYSMHGLGAEALKMFESMQETDITPNQLTFVAVLSACSNTGSLDQGHYYFTTMQEAYGIEPCMEHYTCMVSLLGRLGHLDRALKMIDEIPNEPSVMVWRALLGACVVHKKTLSLEDLLLSMKSMRKKRVKKEPGLSWIENQGMVHYFAVGDDSHPDNKLIRGMLEWLNFRSRTLGYAPNHDAVLLDVEEDEKARLLWLHSERIALAFALLRMPIGSPILIIKNLRVCADCHVSIKVVSKLVQREIVIRDINRFHHFEDGVCSCNDYW
ncbi:putative pentatricopeptide repeat-containing protein, mitochondrial, partial [Sesamum angolense]